MMKYVACGVAALMLATASHATPITSYLLTDSEFAAASVVEKPLAEIRDGDPGRGDWEFAVGLDTQSQNQKTQGELIHSDAYVAFTYSFVAATNELSLTIGTETISYGLGADSIAGYDAIGVRVDGRNTSRNGVERNEGDAFVRNLAFNGMSLSVDAAAGVDSSAVVAFGGVDYTQDFSLTGEYFFDYSAVLPTATEQGLFASARPSIQFKGATADLGADFFVAPVPLPASLPLMLVGFAGIAALRARRRSATAS